MAYYSATKKVQNDAVYSKMTALEKDLVESERAGDIWVARKRF